MSVDRSRIPGARVYRRERSSFWQIQYREEDGRKVRQSSGTEDEARAWEILEEVYTRRAQLAFKEVVVSFFDIRGKNLAPKTVEGYLNSLKAVDPYFGGLSLAEIDLPGIKEFVMDRRRSVSDTSVRRDLAFLSTVFTYAQVEMTGAPEVNPIMSYSKRHLKERRRERYLTHDEYERLRTHCRLPWQKMVITTAVYTGMRHGEICEFQKAWINWTRGGHGEIQLPREYTKSQRDRIIPLLPEFSDTLLEWCHRDPSPWVFSRGTPPVPYHSFRGFFRRARVEANLENLRFHDLRHTFASWWVQRGGDLMTLRSILGHASLQMVERYAHLDTAAAHRAVAELSGHTPGHTAKEEEDS
jgi:integrase